MEIPFSKGSRHLIEKAQADSVAFYGMAGRGATAPGAVTLRKRGEVGYVVHFANTQCGGYSGGDYCDTLGDAYAAFAERIKRYDPAGELHEAFDCDLGVYRFYVTCGDEYETFEPVNDSHLDAMTLANAHWPNKPLPGFWKVTGPMQMAWTEGDDYSRTE